MGFFDTMAGLAKAKEAIGLFQEKRRHKVRSALVAAFADARESRDAAVDTLAEKHLDAILSASSQAGAVRELAKSLGAYDALRSLIDGLEGKA